jgi:hypothetical protein
MWDCEKEGGRVVGEEEVGVSQLGGGGRGGGCVV